MPKYYKGANGIEYFTKEDADNPRMGGGCVGYRDTAPELVYQPITNLTPNPIAGNTVKLVGAPTVAPLIDDVGVSSDLNTKTLAELREIAKAKGIKGYQMFKENTLINKIKAIS